MIFFSGHGILIPIFAIIGFFLGTIAAAVPVAMMNLSLAWTPVGGAWMAALCVLLYAKTIGKTVEKTYLDPATGQPVILRKRHTLFFIPAFPWAVMGMIGAAFVTVAAFFAPKDGFNLEDKPKSASEAKFSSANKEITTDNNGVAQGNSAEAKKLAAEFSSKLKTLREIGIEPSKKRSISLSGGEFITYCQLSKDRCAFLVHVPQLRKYTDEAKEFIGEAAWGVAQHCLATLPEKPKQVAVGIRGIALYDRVLTGEVTEDEDASPKVHEGVKSKDMLFSYFDAEKPAADKTPAKTKEASTTAETSAPLPTPTPAAEPKDAAPAPTSAATPSTPAAMEPATPAPTSTTSAAPASTTSLPTPVRDWKSADGRALSASLEGFANPTTARFKRAADGVVFELGFDKFDAAVQAELTSLYQKENAATGTGAN